MTDPFGLLETCQDVLPSEDSPASLVDSVVLVTVRGLWSEIGAIEVPSFQVTSIVRPQGRADLSTSRTQLVVGTWMDWAWVELALNSLVRKGETVADQLQK